MSACSRYAPHLPLPPYGYVPGMFPHPISDADGHMHASGETSLTMEEEMAFGFDLFNHGYYWEAHESWERRWVSEGRQGAMADVVKGLIKLAAAGVKAREGKSAGVRRHACRAEELFQETAKAIDADVPVTWRSESGVWATHARHIQEGSERMVNTRNDSVVVVFGFQLQMPDPPTGSFVDKSPCEN